MPIHVPAPTQPTNKCPRCGADGVVEQTTGNLTMYVCPKCGTRWVAPMRGLQTSWTWAGPALAPHLAGKVTARHVARQRREAGSCRASER